MKKVVFLQTLATQHQCFVKGKEYDLPDDEARRLVAAHVAHEAPQPPKKVTGDKAPAPVKAEKHQASQKADKATSPVKASKGE